MDEIAIKIEHVSKEYRLGTIGGGTLRGDLQSWMARIRGKEDPNLRIGAGQKGYTGDRFLALDDVSFEVKKGEAVGIIGHNGAGKSTLLKLLSRVTAPTKGKISYNGRVASMLEVGTGFHPELTGRENVYMNGAILGMTKAEIDKKFDDIVAFAEMEKFIDTPVKRYSSGMYVKLAFSVAAHLDSEIMIMDEVLAVGDMKFQQKCLDRMGDAANSEGRTVLYVSHNMNTIRQLCSRCIVLDHGKVIFDGAAESAIELYAEVNKDNRPARDYNEYVRPSWLHRDDLRIISARFCDRKSCRFKRDELIKIRFEIEYSKRLENINLRYEIWNRKDEPVATSVAMDLPILAKSGIQYLEIACNVKSLVSGEYRGFYTFFTRNELGGNEDVDCVPSLQIEIEESNFEQYLKWDPIQWGQVEFPVPLVEVIDVD